MGAQPILPPLLDFSQKIMEAAGKAYDATYKQVMDKTNDPRQAQTAATTALIKGGVEAMGTQTVVGVGMVAADVALAAFFSFLSSFRKQTTHDFDDTAAEVVNEFLGTDLDASIMSMGKGSDERMQKANAIGKAVLKRLEEEFTGGGTVSPDTGAQGAATFAGYGVNFAIQNAIISLLGSCVPETRLDDIRELGVEVAQNLGLGRLMNRALRPLVENTITKPYNRALASKYQQDLLSTADLAIAALADRMPSDNAMKYLKEHGLSDDQITELLEQKTPRLKDQEWELLQALGENFPDQDLLHDAAVGMPKESIDLRLKVITFKRLEHLRNHVLSEMVAQARQGYFKGTDIRALAQRLGLPDDEQQLWVDAVGQFEGVPRKRLSMSEMLFLYEAAQINQSDVTTWATAEGYSPTDVDRLTTYFELKATEAAQKTTGGAAAAAAHLHKEHIAYVTDEISGLWGRQPTAAELNYWVNLLDTKERTKHDFVTELKALPTTGPAMP